MGEIRSEGLILPVNVGGGIGMKNDVVERWLDGGEYLLLLCMLAEGIDIALKSFPSRCFVPASNTE